MKQRSKSGRKAPISTPSGGPVFVSPEDQKRMSLDTLILRPEGHKREETDENGETSEFVWTTYRSTNVFNLSDLEGDDLTAFIDEALGGVTPRPEPERLEAAEAVLDGWEVKPKFGGSRALYMPATETICVPTPARFETAAAFIVGLK